MLFLTWIQTLEFRHKRHFLKPLKQGLKAMWNYFKSLAHVVQTIIKEMINNQIQCILLLSITLSWVILKENVFWYLWQVLIKTIRFSNLSSLFWKQAWSVFKGEAVDGNWFVAVEWNEEELPWDNPVLEANSMCYSGKLPYPPSPSAAGCMLLCWQLWGGRGSGSQTSGLTQSLVLGCNKTRQAHIWFSDKHFFLVPKLPVRFQSGKADLHITVNTPQSRPLWGWWGHSTADQSCGCSVSRGAAHHAQGPGQPGLLTAPLAHGRGSVPDGL